MVYKRNSAKTILEAVVLCLLLVGTVFIGPVGSQSNQKTVVTSNPNKTYYSPGDNGPFVLDRSYYSTEEMAVPIGMVGNDDAGYKKDAPNTIGAAAAIYVGELIDDTPGRGRNGALATNDIIDYYMFPIAAGQQVHITMTPPADYNFDLGLYNQSGANLVNSTNPDSTPEDIVYTSATTMKLYFGIRWISGSSVGRYDFTINMLTQNDANTGGDASNVMGGAIPITPGSISGYLDMNDPYDWYTFAFSSGQWYNLSLGFKSVATLTDFDLKLYNPSGTLIYAGNNYLDDGFDFQATSTGNWYARVEIFPGWVDCPQPTDWQYYSYGSGPYTLTLTEKTSGTALPGPIPEPQITPIAKTFIVPNDPNSVKDEYGYLAAIPACNYLAGGQRYLAPIIYSGDMTPTAYYDDSGFGTVDDTTQYLVADWNAYLATFGKTPTQYTLTADPIAAAADIATHSWTTAPTAVVAVDGSGLEDTTKSVLKKTTTLKRSVEIIPLSPTDPKLESSFGYMMTLGPKWGAISVNVTGIKAQNGNAAGAIIDNLFPIFMPMQSDDWPSPYDAAGWAGDTYMPIARAGFWAAYSGLGNTSFTNLTITKYEGDRYHFKVRGDDTVLTAKLTTDEAADLLVFLVDPKGIIRAPIMPAWNGPVNPIHIWNGLENPAYNPWRCWRPAPHTEFTAQVLHPEVGTWTAIVVPRNAEGDDVKYTLDTTVQTVNPDRTSAEVSAANAAVIASMNHYPLLYVNADSIPAATASAFTALGVTKVIFVERDNIGSGVRSSLPTIDKDLTDMQAIVDTIKGTAGSENYIAVTSLKTGDGYFAPAAMLAAYHGAPVLNIADSPDGDAAATAERVQAWQRWDGDYYHGSRANGHMPEASAPVDQSKLKLLITLLKAGIQKNFSIIPDIGLDAKRYWNEEMYTNFHNYVVSLGLDKAGQEGYAIIAPREDVNMEFHSALMGNNSYAGQIPGITPAHSSAMVVRNVLYPALIFANQGRDYTTTQMLNYPEGLSFRLNDGKTYIARSSQAVKRSFSSHFRTYEGHTFWRAHLQRMNEGASAFYYSGHGTGGSGMGAMYEQLDASHYPTQVWWDSWRGYMYDAWKMPRDCAGLIWFNPEPPELYDLVHYKWIDQTLDNLHSNAVFYMSCTTGDGYGPMVYLDHGAVCWYGNSNTGLCPEADIGDDAFFDDVMVDGMSIGVAFSHQVWLHYRDFTTSDNASMYGPASLYPIASIQVIYGDPSLVVYSPEWTSPVPIDA